MTSPALTPRFGVTDDQIAAVVTEFYAVARSHPGLGPIFAAHVTDWDAHEAKVIRFWKNAIRLERGYDGNPLAVHKAAGDVRPGMFIPWLNLFEAVLRRNLPPDTAAAWAALANRIGESLLIGMMRDSMDPPKLR
jgi:hemoglobin